MINHTVPSNGTKKDCDEMILDFSFIYEVIMTNCQVIMVY